jgi:hypothetical protein
MTGHAPARAVADVARAAGVDLGWLLTGEGSEAPGAGAAIDYSLLCDSIEGLERFLKESGAEMDPGRKAEEVVAAYREFSSGGHEAVKPEHRARVVYLAKVFAQRSRSSR